MFSIFSSRYFFYREPTDMRKSFDGLCGLITNRLEKDPMSGDVFIFINRKRTHIKILRWEAGGFVLFYKRLEKGSFELPQAKNKEFNTTIDYSQLVMLITGISMKYAKKRTRFLPQKHVGKQRLKYTAVSS